MQSIKLTDVLFLLCAGKRSSDISRSYDVIAGFPVAPSVSRRKKNREVPFNGEMKKTQNITKQNSLKAVRTNVLNLLISSAKTFFLFLKKTLKQEKTDGGWIVSPGRSFIGFLRHSAEKQSINSLRSSDSAADGWQRCFRWPKALPGAECKTTKLWQSSASLVFLQSTDFPRWWWTPERERGADKNKDFQAKISAGVERGSRSHQKRGTSFHYTGLEKSNQISFLPLPLLSTGVVWGHPSFGNWSAQWK